MKLKLFSIIMLIVCLVGTAGCSSEELSFKVSKAEDFTSAFNEMSSKAADLKYPQQVPYDGVIPKSWYMECNHPTASPETLSCFLGIPLEKSYEITTLNLPCGTKYGRCILPSNDAEGLIIAWGDRDSMRAFHRYYYVKIPPVYPGQQKDYGIEKSIDDMAALNPYTYEGNDRQAVADNFTVAAKALQEKVTVLERDVNAAMSWMDYLEKTFFLPNTRTWDKQAEVAAYRKSMTEIKDQVAELKVQSDKFAAWQF